MSSLLAASACWAAIATISGTGATIGAASGLGLAAGAVGSARTVITALAGVFAYGASHFR